MEKSLLFIHRKPPYGTSSAQEALDVMLMASAFTEKVSLLFLDDGVFQLIQSQDPSKIHVKNFLAAYKALDLYEIKKVFVDKESLLTRNLTTNDLMIPAEMLTTDQITQLIASYNLLFNF